MRLMAAKIRSSRSARTSRVAQRHQKHPTRQEARHRMSDHFPSLKELLREEAHLGIVRPPDGEMAWLRFKRHLRALGGAPRELLRWEDSLGTVSAPVTREFLRWEDSLRSEEHTSELQS